MKIPCKTARNKNVREAELRQQTAPLRKQISQLEEKMNKHASKLAEIEINWLIPNSTAQKIKKN